MRLAIAKSVAISIALSGLRDPVVAAKPMASGPRLVRGALERWEPVDAFFQGGSFRFRDDNNVLTAHCRLHGCRKARTCTGGPRPGQGKPLGYLSAWLAGGNVMSKAQHASFNPSYAERQLARQKLRQDSSMARLMDLESDPSPDEPLEFR